MPNNMLSDGEKPYAASRLPMTRLCWLALRQLVNGDTIGIDRNFTLSGVPAFYTTFDWLRQERYIRFNRLTDVYEITESGRRRWQEENE